MVCRKCLKNIPEGSVFCNFCGQRQQPVSHKRRRGNGLGTAYKRGPGWACEKTFGYDPDGKRIFARKSGFKTKKEAYEYIPFLVPRGRKAPRDSSPDITLKGLYDLWYPTHQASDKTLEGYRTAFKMFAPVWHFKMSEITIDDLQECMDEYITKSGTSGKRTRQTARAGLGLVYKYGIPRGYVPPNLAGQPNLASFLKITGDGSMSTKDGFTAQELEMIRQAVSVVPYADYILCACYLGFRPSAFLALEIKDYDRKNKALTGGIKTEAGINRIVTISPKIQPIIDRLTADRISGLIFGKTDGTALNLKEYREIFYKALDEIGIDNPIDSTGTHRLTPHSCRHTFADLLKNIQAPDKDKLELIGHTSEEMLRYYQSVSIDDLKKITDFI